MLDLCLLFLGVVLCGWLGFYAFAEGSGGGLFCGFGGEGHVIEDGG